MSKEPEKRAYSFLPRSKNLDKVRDKYEAAREKIMLEEAKVLSDIDELLGEAVLKIRGSANPPWINGVGMCEDCGVREATVNLNLKHGTHRECERCWAD